MVTRGRCSWTTLRNAASRRIEEALGAAFPGVDAYQDAPASFRVRVVDPGFAGLDPAARRRRVAAALDRLPGSPAAGKMRLFLLTPAEVARGLGAAASSAAFEDTRLEPFDARELP